MNKAYFSFICVIRFLVRTEVLNQKLCIGSIHCSEAYAYIVVQLCSCVLTKIWSAHSQGSVTEAGMYKYHWVYENDPYLCFCSSAWSCPTLVEEVKASASAFRLKGVIW